MRATVINSSWYDEQRTQDSCQNWIHEFNHEETSEEPKLMVIIQNISPVLFKCANALKEENKGGISG